MGQEEAELLQALSVCDELVAELLADGASVESLASYAEAGVFEDAPVGDDNAYVARGLALMRQTCDEFMALNDDERQEFVQGLLDERLRLLLGCGAPQAPIVTSHYLDPNHQMMGAQTLAVRAAFRAWGLSAQTTDSLPDDNLASLLRFLAFLLVQEAEGCEGAAEAQVECLKTHVLPWMAQWHYLMEKHSASTYHRGIADLAFGFLQVHALRFGIRYDEQSASFKERRGTID